MSAVETSYDLIATHDSFRGLASGGKHTVVPRSFVLLPLDLFVLEYSLTIKYRSGACVARICGQHFAVAFRKQLEPIFRSDTRVVPQAVPPSG